MLQKRIIFLIFISFQALVGYSQSNNILSNIQWTYAEIPVYQRHESFAGQTTLDMGYASHQIKNPRIWTNDIRKKYIYEVDLVLSKYPKDKEDWLTNYDSLMKKRVYELYALIPELEQNKNIKWNLVLQTDCETEADAKQMFHGAVVKYKLHLTSKLKWTLQNVRDIINGKEGFEDSVVFQVFDRNKDWKNILVVNDWTGSMYQYGAQAVLWHRFNLKENKGTHSAINHFVFFNDGNLLPDDEKEIGKTGGIYYSEASSTRKIAHTMREVMLSGYGGDKPENDLEAVMKGMEKATDFQDIILIADNSSAVRDMELLSQINQPIKIILCGSGQGKPIHPDYLKIAHQTNGSIHTINEDIIKIGKLQEGDVIEVAGLNYFIKDGDFVMLAE